MAFQVEFLNNRPVYTGTIKASELATLLNDGSQFDIYYKENERKVSGDVSVITTVGDSYDIAIGSGVDIVEEAGEKWVEQVYTSLGTDDAVLDMSQTIYACFNANDEVPLEWDGTHVKLTVSQLISYGIDKVGRYGSKLDGVADIIAD